MFPTFLSEGSVLQNLSKDLFIQLSFGGNYLWCKYHAKRNTQLGPITSHCWQNNTMDQRVFWFLHATNC